MNQSFQKSELGCVLEDLGRDPTSIWAPVLTHAGFTPAALQPGDDIRRLQDLAGNPIGIDDMEARLRKAGGRRGLAAADTARESDDHTPPYLPGRPRANLKRGWARTVGRGQRRRLG